ncbi:MAG: hypothetical protein J7450_12105 [Thermomicrobium sp.]|uniref:hypothetical protein n=1 Tax=Thermomicrobium sp. TaxID=1969469 RepID=UPI001B17B759|nr:hypothetical protein [Thermomicrobium sp.]MBO9360287.1 hypothetical protein [Thermomicrobium sp.]
MNQRTCLATVIGQSAMMPAEIGSDQCEGHLRWSTDPAGFERSLPGGLSATSGPIVNASSAVLLAGFC